MVVETRRKVNGELEPGRLARARNLLKTMRGRAAAATEDPEDGRLLRAFLETLDALLDLRVQSAKSSDPADKLAEQLILDELDRAHDQYPVLFGRPEVQAVKDKNLAKLGPTPVPRGPRIPPYLKTKKRR